jgi:hypothetical protein
MKNEQEEGSKERILMSTSHFSFTKDVILVCNLTIEEQIIEYLNNRIKCLKENKFHPINDNEITIITDIIKYFYNIKKL